MAGKGLQTVTKPGVESKHMYIPVPLCFNSGLRLHIPARSWKLLTFAIVLLPWKLHNLRYHCSLLLPGVMMNLRVSEVKRLVQDQTAI